MRNSQEPLSLVMAWLPGAGIPFFHLTSRRLGTARTMHPRKFRIAVFLSSSRSHSITNSQPR